MIVLLCNHNKIFSLSLKVFYDMYWWRLNLLDICPLNSTWQRSLVYVEPRELCVTKCFKLIIKKIIRKYKCYCVFTIHISSNSVVKNYNIRSASFTLKYEDFHLLFQFYFIILSKSTLLKKFKGAHTLWQIAVKTDIPSFDTKIQKK